MSKSETQVIVEPSTRGETANVVPMTVVEMSHRAVAAAPIRRSGIDDSELSLRDPANELDVAVVEAGPYGLSVAAHLAGHCRVRVFGKPMRTSSGSISLLRRSAIGFVSARRPAGRSFRADSRRLAKVSTLRTIRPRAPSVPARASSRKRGSPLSSAPPWC
jgi:hypothetical protein